MNRYTYFFLNSALLIIFNLNLIAQESPLQPTINIRPSLQGEFNKKCPAEVNLIENGNFMYGNDGSFQSMLQYSCNSCNTGSYCVGNQFKNKCSSWPNNLFDHTIGNISGSFLIVDGNANQPVDIWADSVCVCAGKTYTFSFWVKSLYPASRQIFDIEMLINNSSQKVVTISQQTPSWIKYEVIWISQETKCIPISLRQVSGGAYRDFGLDDIFFGFCCDCQPAEIKPNCGKFAIALYNGSSTMQFSKVRLTTTQGKMVDAMVGDMDGTDDWNQIIGPNYSYIEWNFSGSPIPMDLLSYIDAEMYIWMDPTIMTNQSIRVDWYDNSAIPVIIATQNIFLPTLGDPNIIYPDQYDWEANTSIAPGGSIDVFSGAAPENCELDLLDRSDCPRSITYSVSCSNNKLYLTFSTQPLATGESAINWYYSIDNSVDNVATTNMQLTQSGTYTLYLVVNHSQVFAADGTDITPEDCEKEITFDVALPIPIISEPEITPTTPINGICNFQVKLDALQSSNVSGIPASSYSWQITGPENKNQVGKSFSAVFLAVGVYTAVLTITDIYGCKYTLSKTFTLTLNCEPKFTWGTYYWCKKNNITPGPANITIIFTNKSQGGKCPQSYEISFSDEFGSPWHAINTFYTKTFNQVPGVGANYTVKLRMKDNINGGNCSTGKIYSEVIRLEPYYVDFTIEPCPDGKVFFNTNNDNPIWSFPGNGNPIKWILQSAIGFFGWYHNSNPIVQYNPAFNSATNTYSQYYAATLTAVNNVTHAQCSEIKEFVVEQLCCTPKVKDNAYFYNTLGNKDYRMWVHWKWKIKEFNPLNVVHTKVKVSNRVAKMINKRYRWWRRVLVDEIYAGIEGTYYTKDLNGRCECMTQNTQPDARKTHDTAHPPYLKRGKCVYRPGIHQTRNIRDQEMKVKFGIKVGSYTWDDWTYFKPCH